MDIKMISLDEALKIMNSVCDDDSESDIPLGLYLANDQKLWIGIDHSNGDCFVEESTDKEIIIQWLKGEIGPDEVFEFNLRKASR